VGGNGGEPGPDPRSQTPPPTGPRASALLNQGRLHEIPEGPRRRGLGAIEEEWASAFPLMPLGRSLPPSLPRAVLTLLWGSFSGPPFQGQNPRKNLPEQAPVSVTTFCHLPMSWVSARTALLPGVLSTVDLSPTPSQLPLACSVVCLHCFAPCSLISLTSVIPVLYLPPDLKPLTSGSDVDEVWTPTSCPAKAWLV
jgi:hypothetical protein